MAVKTFRDGRKVHDGKDYTEFKKAKWIEQGKRCADCGLYVAKGYWEFHHYGGRGMGGSKRNDIDPRNRVLCCGPNSCHDKARFEHLADKRAAKSAAKVSTAFDK